MVSGHSHCNDVFFFKHSNSSLINSTPLGPMSSKIMTYSRKEKFHTITTETKTTLKLCLSIFYVTAWRDTTYNTSSFSKFFTFIRVSSLKYNTTKKIGNICIFFHCISQVFFYPTKVNSFHYIFFFRLL